MTANVVQMQVAARVPHEAVVTALERLLEEAKQGNISELVCCYSDGVEPPIDMYVGSGDPKAYLAMIGSMELCKQTMLAANFGEAGPPAASPA